MLYRHILFNYSSPSFVYYRLCQEYRPTRYDEVEGSFQFQYEHYHSEKSVGLSR